MNLDNQNECPQCNSTTIQNKETKWECEDCAFSWNKDNSLDNQIDEWGKTFRLPLTTASETALKSLVESECRQAKIDAVKYLTVDFSGNIYRQNVPIENYIDQLSALKEEE